MTPIHPDQRERSRVHRWDSPARRAVLGLLVTVPVLGIAGWAAAAAAPDAARPAVIGCAVVAGVLVGAAVAAAAHRGAALARAAMAVRALEFRAAQAESRAAEAGAIAETNRLAAERAEAEVRELRERAAASERRAAAAEQQAAAAERDLGHTVGTALPALVEQLRGRVPVEEALTGIGQPATGPLRDLLRTVGGELSRERQKRTEMVAAFRSIAGRLQALVAGNLARLREMQDRYEADALDDLFQLDSTTSQTGRMADRIAVLTGALSGKHWPRPIVIWRVLRAATSRIEGLERVEIRCTSEQAVVGAAAEKVITLLAELIDNAVSFSPPSTLVNVYVQEVPRGLAVEIADSGLAMRPDMLARAQQAVTDDPSSMLKLSGTRQGLLVVGMIARKFGLLVRYQSSATGGTAVTVLIPQQLLTEPRAEHDAPGHEASGHETSGHDAPGHHTAAPPLPSRRPPSRPWSPPEEPSDERPGKGSEERSGAHPLTPEGLPRRRRKQVETGTERGAEPPAPPSPVRKKPAEAGDRFGSFHTAVKQDRTRTTPRSEGTTS
ncbi:ATP-binding protein [Streptomyces sp. NBRC 110028]|uniref:sensor histidine kinase n=1 Tax=Streptomyces sp. NBRC 110028 TaxID=1621260 RepID=UPI000A997A6C|nr:ATP-binding protein [Streptomyces sp. NBRC 110028]